MPPLRGAALIPLLTVLGTTAAAAVLAQKFVPQYFANKHKKSPNHQDDSKEDQTTESPARKMATQTVVQPPHATAKKANASAVASLQRSNNLVAVLLQDPYLLISAFGVCIMVVAVLVSLALVEMRDDVASLNDLQMFGPLMLVAMGLISLGMVLSMVSPKATPVVMTEPDEEEEIEEAKATSVEDVAALKKAAQDGDQGFLYNYYKNKYANEPTEVEVDGEDGQPKKRVSRCPFGFT